MVKKKMLDKLEKHVPFSKKEIGLFFLGVGFTMFLLNITTYIQLLPYIEFLNSMGLKVLMTGYYTSIVSSIILILYSVYNIYNN